MINAVETGRAPSLRVLWDSYFIGSKCLPSLHLHRNFLDNMLVVNVIKRVFPDMEIYGVRDVKVNGLEVHRGYGGGQVIAPKPTVAQVDDAVFHKLYLLDVGNRNLPLERAEEVEKTDTVKRVQKRDAMFRNDLHVCWMELPRKGDMRLAQSVET